MVNWIDKLIKESEDNKPFLFYLENGKLLEYRGFDKRKAFTTHFFILDPTHTGKTGCITLKPLIPILYCKQLLLTSSSSTVLVERECILGFQSLPNAEVTDVVIEHYEYGDKICGKFTIPENFTETIIWKSNDPFVISNFMELIYDEGKEDYIEVKVDHTNRAVKTYRLYKNTPIRIDITSGKTVTVSKKDLSTKSSGQFSIEFTGDIIETVHL